MAVTKEFRLSSNDCVFEILTCQSKKGTKHNGMTRFEQEFEFNLLKLYNNEERTASNVSKLNNILQSFEEWI